MIFINLFALFLFTYTALLKVAVNREGCNALDICLARVFYLMLGSLAIVWCSGASMYIEKQDRWLLFWRGFIGTVGFTCLALGVALIPLLIQNTIFNTAPFWASILGWVFL